MKAATIIAIERSSEAGQRAGFRPRLKLSPGYGKPQGRTDGIHQKRFAGYAAGDRDNERLKSAV